MQALVRPPFIPNHFVRLFVCGQNAEAIEGDLAEEFAELASTTGLEHARRWYWRQSVKTVANIIVATFRAAPLMMTATIVGGFLLLGFAMRIDWVYSLPSLSLPGRMIEEVLGQPYTWPPMPFFSWIADSAGLALRLIVAISVGCIVALITKSREMIATTALGFLCGMLCSIELPLWFAKFASTHAYPPLWFAAISNFVYPPALILGGVIVCVVRSRATVSSPKAFE